MVLLAWWPWIERAIIGVWCFLSCYCRWQKAMHASRAALTSLSRCAVSRLYTDSCASLAVTCWPTRILIRSRAQPSTCKCYSSKRTLILSGSVYFDIIIFLLFFNDWFLEVPNSSGQIFRIGTVRYAEGLWRMRRHGPVIAHCTDSEDFPIVIILHVITPLFVKLWHQHTVPYNNITVSLL